MSPPKDVAVVDTVPVRGLFDEIGGVGSYAGPVDRIFAREKDRSTISAAGMSSQTGSPGVSSMGTTLSQRRDITLRAGVLPVLRIE